MGRITSDVEWEGVGPLEGGGLQGTLVCRGEGRALCLQAAMILEMSSPCALLMRTCGGGVTFVRE